ncbi:MAG: imidazole glycerol phosphate synthase subunit HisF [Acidobacteria bacterium]|nr:imidazole glycerol phosphate synthase subunit HisF [Acidobacteriota bacterium]MCB9398042.1 imidazole glycerol phosphate synthase subunit HisF [Acidobacteriota bacterium]
MSGLMKRIIPCLDVNNGRVVKGIHFEGLRDMGDPVELALRYQDQGADELVFLDITATVDARPTALAMVRRVSQALSIPFTLGGGLRSVSDISDFLEAGADKVCFNSAALADPSLLNRASQHFGSQCIVVAMDVKRDGEIYRVYSHGGKKGTERQALAWAIEVADRGAGEILLTSIDRDGTGLGYDLSVLQSVTKRLRVPVIASGGAQSAEHLAEGLAHGASAVLAATMFHSGAYTIQSVKQHLAQAGIPVRLETLPC